jgi:hypothetical protein
VKERDKAWREANPEKVKERDKAWREANPEKVKERDKAWREANPEKVILNKLKHKGITDPPEEMIELIVARRELKRNFKELNKRIKEHDPIITDV